MLFFLAIDHDDDHSSGLSSYTGLVPCLANRFASRNPTDFTTGNATEMALPRALIQESAPSLEDTASSDSVRCNYFVHVDVWMLVSHLFEHDLVSVRREPLNHNSIKILSVKTFKKFNGMKKNERDTDGTPAGNGGARAAATGNGSQTHAHTRGRFHAHGFARATGEHGTRFPGLSMTFSQPPIWVSVRTAFRWTRHNESERTTVRGWRFDG